MKRLLSCLSFGYLALSSLAVVASPVLVPAWQSEAKFEGPESVVFNAQDKSFFVSNVNGNPNDVDGNGYISKLSLDGEILEQHWIDGLNAPKGLALIGDTLYVADINELVVINTQQHKIIKRYKDSNAVFLNDVAAAGDGTIYVSDMMTNTIYRLHDDKFEPWIQSNELEQPNGLLVEGNNLIVGSWGNMTKGEGFATKIAGHLKTIDISTKKISSLGDKKPAGNLDGVESDGKGNYFVTDWMKGILLHITPKGEATTLVVLQQGSADLTVLLDQNLVIIPMMLTGNVIAFEIKK